MNQTIASFLLLTLFSQISHSQTLRLATYQYADNDRVSSISPLAEHLETKLGYPVTVKSYPTVHLFIKAIRNNDVDVALINTFGYLLLESSGDFPMDPLLALDVKVGTADNYKTAFITPYSSPISSLKGIKEYALNTHIMFVSAGSTSGNMVPRLALSSVALHPPEKWFRTLSYGKTHRATIDSVAAGKADLAAVGSSAYFSFITDPEKKNKIKLLWLSPEIPLGPVLVNKNLSFSLTESIIREFLTLEKSNPIALKSVKEGWSEAKEAERFIQIDSTYYSPFKDQFGDPAVLRDILEQFMQ